MTTHSRRQVLAGASAAAVGGLAGCLGTLGLDDEGDNQGTGDGTLGNPADAAEVRVLDMPNPSFDPVVVHVDPGATVRWAVEGEFHTVTAYHPDTYGDQRIPDGAEPFSSGILRRNGSYEWTFEEEGVYDYVDTRTLCAPHEALGAVGRVVVGWPDPDDEPACRHDVDELRGRASQVMREANEETRAVLDDR